MSRLKYDSQMLIQCLSSTKNDNIYYDRNLFSIHFEGLETTVVLLGHSLFSF